jgi:hypothetical protein
MKFFGDRDYTVSSVPSILDGTEHIITACGSKNYAGNEAKFSVNGDSTVYVALDNRVSAPSWLSSYTNTGSSVSCNGESFILYSKDFSAGEQVILGANSTEYNCMNYTVFIKAKPVETTTTTVPTTTTTETVTTTESAPVGRYKPGDANCDGDVTVADATLIMQNLSNGDDHPISDDGKDNGDVNERGDGITAADALTIQKYLADLISDLPETA